MRLSNAKGAAQHEAPAREPFQLFVEGFLNTTAGARPSAALEARLLECWNSASQAWPELSLPPERFGAFLGQRLPDGAISLIDALDSLRVRELALTCACAHWDPRAIRLLETRYLPVVCWTLRRLRLSASRIDEVQALLLEQLIVGGDGRSPTIANYSGRGSLRSWLSISGVRAAYKISRREERETVERASRMGELAPPGVDLEERYSAAVCGSLVRQSFVDALGRLSERERVILRQHYLEEQTIADVAGRCGTHRATMARWLAAARRKLLHHARTLLRTRLRAPEKECEEIIRTALRAEHASDTLVPALHAW
jgi:RNA polymerase sigma-70 factor, ECF subfamily